MPDIIPAVLPKNYEDLKDRTSMVRGIVPVVQVDICDGAFVKNTTWPFIKGQNDKTANLDAHFRKILNEEEGMPFWEDIDFELDLMVRDAVPNFDIYSKLGPRRIISHLDAVGDLEEFNHFLEGIDNYVRDVMEFGIAISPQENLEKVFPLINSVDFVQCMGIDNEGVQGEEFDEKCLDQIKKLKEKFPDLTVSVDGGVSFETAPKLIQVGADRLVIGSAIFRSNDIIETIEEFKNL